MKIEERLSALNKVNRNMDFINQRLYRMLYSRELFEIAYKNIMSNRGILTKGVDSDTADGASLKLIDKIILELKDESYKPKPSRRVYITKTNGGKRPLGLPSFRDKLVQECINIILNLVYDSTIRPTFSHKSFGFRKGLGCHAALKEVHTEFQYCAWVIKADVKGFFDNVDHNILITFLRKRINDERFLNLIRKFLKAGYVENGELFNPKKGTPQGGIISPILSNIYLHEFDVFVSKLKADYHTEIIENVIYGQAKNIRDSAKRSLSKLSIHNEFYLHWKNSVAKQKGIMDNQASKQLEDSNGAIIKYCRYADDWVIGIKGTYKVSKEIYDKCRAFFKDTLNLEWNESKSLLVRSTKTKVEFLGVYLKYTSLRGVRKVTRKSSKGNKFTKRSLGVNSLALVANRVEILKRLRDKGFINSNNIGIHYPKVMNHNVAEIVKLYNSVYLGIHNYYRFIHNVSILTHVHYLLKVSLVKTLAAKFKTSASAIYRRYGKSVTLEFRKRKYRYVVPKDGFKRNARAFNVKLIQFDWAEEDWYRKLRSQSMIGISQCCLCGSSISMEMHHVKHVRKSGYKYGGMSKIMGIVNRKQLPVCLECHKKIHRGEYDGADLRKLSDMVKKSLKI